MRKRLHSELPLIGQFNTLAQNGTTHINKPAIIVNGKGSELANKRTMKGRAKRKIITQTMMLSMIDIADKNGMPDRKKSYWNTYHCLSRVNTVNGRVHGRYCKNRFCTVCCCIRKADIINRYLPVIQNWEEPFFVTLTVKAVPHKNLNAVMRNMTKAFRIIVETCRKQNLRRKGVKLVGIRSLECNFNPHLKTYNPHFHVIVANSQMADILISQWIERSKPGKVHYKAQHKKKVFNNIFALIEVVKYGSKIFTEPDLNKKIQNKGKEKIFVLALNNIFNAMKGLRIFDRFGFNLSTKAQNKMPAAIVKNYDEWVFILNNYDWINFETGELLADYMPPAILMEMLNNNLDIAFQ